MFVNLDLSKYLLPVYVLSVIGCMLDASEVSQRERILPRCSESFLNSPFLVEKDTTYDWYHYRILSRYYDSSQLDCMYGEFCASFVTDSTQRIRFKGHFPNVIDTTLDRVNELALTRSFLVGDKSNLTFYRIMSVVLANQGQINLDISDTTIWTVELWHTQQNQIIATLDSMVIFPTTNGINIPPHYPETEAYATITCNLSSFSFVPDDSACIKIKLAVHGQTAGNASGYAIRDLITAYYKLSDSLSFGMAKRGKYVEEQISFLNPELHVRLWPNPSYSIINIRIDSESPDSYSIELMNVLGQRIGSIYSGSVNKGANYYVYNISPGLPSGEYVVVCKNLASKAIISSKISINHQ